MARAESSKAVEGLCAGDVLDELLRVITELVLEATVATRRACTLQLRHVGDDLVVVVDAGRCLWAVVSLRHGRGPQG